MAISRIGSNAKSYSIIQGDFGTTPIAQSPNETLTLTSSDGTVIITGDLATDTIDFSVPAMAATLTANLNVYSGVSSVASGASTDVVTYTVPLATDFYLELVEYNGENIARFQVFLNGSPIATRNTWFGGQLYGEFHFDKLLLSAGDVVKLQVLHGRPMTGDFQGRILGTTV